MLPAVVRWGHALVSPTGGLAAFLALELQTPKLDALYAQLWLAGLPTPARPLLRQRLMNRRLSPTERPDEHLVWHDGQILVKPLPDYLLCHAFWERHLCGSGNTGDSINNDEIKTHASAVGLLLSYAWLVQYRSDFALAREAQLLPEGFDYAAWAALVRDVVAHVDTTTLAQVDRRYRYGELRLSRLDTLTRLRALCAGRDFVQGHVNFSTRYGAFFETKFGWLLAAFAFFSVILSALQVGLATRWLADSAALQRLSAGVTLAALTVALSSILWIVLVWLVLLPYHVFSTRRFVRRVERSRRHDDDTTPSYVVQLDFAWRWTEGGEALSLQGFSTVGCVQTYK